MRTDFLLEPKAENALYPRDLPCEQQSLASIAMSLKRLADIAEAWASGAFNYDPNNGGSHNG